ncbi:hypothetical protein KKD72_01040 [Patescibacteria group bacterium]|nr:hypothetical protein [Patescibacteria group bacterium]
MAREQKNKRIGKQKGMIPYQTNKNKLPGTNYSEVRKQAIFVFNQVKKRTKRRPYIRSFYFKKQKIFFDYFWAHLRQKPPKERFKRLQYFEAAIDLIKNCKKEPTSKQNPNKKTEIIHRFIGITKNKEQFFVQIKEDLRTDKKYFMSCFPSRYKDE